MPTWNQATLQVYNNKQMAANGPPQPRAVALVGAKMAIGTDELAEHHASGKTHDEIVTLLNARYAKENAHLIEAAAAWTKGPYLTSIEEHRRRVLEQMAYEARAQAVVRQAVEFDAKENG